MIRLPRNFLANLSLDQYREQLKLLPKISDKKTKLYTMLALTLAALSFFGIFAINPTLSTIAELKRQYKDLGFVYKELQIKSQNLSLLQDKYRSLSPLLQAVYEGMPPTPEAPKFMGEVNALLKRTHLTVKSLRVSGAEVTPDKKKTGKSPSYFGFSMEAEGSYEDIIAFSENLVRINRLVVEQSISIEKDQKKDNLIFSLRGIEYFKP